MKWKREPPLHVMMHAGGHVKNGGAPLHPAVVSQAAGGGRLHLTPRVQTGDVAPVTSTYAS